MPTTRTGDNDTLHWVLPNDTETRLHMERIMLDMQRMQMRPIDTGRVVHPDDFIGFTVEHAQEGVAETEEQRVQREQFEAERAERRRRQTLPVTISILETTQGGRPLYVVQTSREGIVLDEWRERNLANAQEVFRNLQERHAEDLARRVFDNTPGTDTRLLDLTGARALRASAMRGRRNTDRRRVRPADDVVAEDSLVLSIDPNDETPIEPMTTPDNLVDGELDIDDDDDLFF